MTSWGALSIKNISEFPVSANRTGAITRIRESRILQCILKPTALFPADSN